jgi:maltose/moltooligosaccharide transporter
VVQTAYILQTAVFYLYADVVPGELMGRFLAAFRLVGSLGALIFQWYLLPQFEVKPILVWTISGAVYLVFFWLMIYFVKEGSYEPPKVMSWKNLVKNYVNDGLGNRYIWFLWLTLGTIALATPTWSFIVLYAKEELHFSLEKIGHYTGYGTMATMVVALPAGWLIDRYGAKWVWGIAALALGLVNLWAYVGVHDEKSMIFFMIGNFSINAFLSTALLPMLYQHIPKDRFGEVVSAQSFVVQGFTFISTNALGQIIVWLGQGYKISFAYGGAFLSLTPLFLFFLMRMPSPWKIEEKVC